MQIRAIHALAIVAKWPASFLPGLSGIYVAYVRTSIYQLELEEGRERERERESDKSRFPSRAVKDSINKVSVSSNQTQLWERERERKRASHCWLLLI